MSGSSEAEDPRFRLLAELGVGEVPHNSGGDLLAHLTGTFRLMCAWDARPALCNAALFHSIYGTEFFKTTPAGGLPREKVCATIGSEAEKLVWLWCFGRRQSLGPSLAGRSRPRIRHRQGNQWILLRESQLDDIISLWIADTLEQLPRVPRKSLPTARSLMPYRDRALPGARAALEAAVQVGGRS